MDAALALRTARRRAGLTQRELASRAGTSQPAVAAYESGRKQPSLVTLERLLGATGASLRAVAMPGGRTRAELERSGVWLAEVLALAEELPFRPAPALRYPRLPS